MYYYPPVKDGENGVVMTYPMSIGRMDWETPLGRTRIVSKMRKPSWYPPASVLAEHEADGNPLPRVVPPGPDNPLGDYAMRLGLPSYLIHGTNRPAGVGMRVTHGCIRMFPEDIGYLFDLLGVDTRVQIINEPVKLGWDGEDLVLEVHRMLETTAPPEDVALTEIADALLGEDTEAGDPGAGRPEEISLAEAVAVETLPEVTEPDRSALTLVTEKFVEATGARAGELDWNDAEAQLALASGIPVVVGRSTKNAATSAAFE
jgi:L,D-transpeptidase ErfK/SrfK